MHGTIAVNEASNAPYEVEGAETLMAGHIIRADIPTIEDGIVKFYTRDCIVLGFEATPRKNGITGVYLARLAYNRQKFNAEYGRVYEDFDFANAGINGMYGSFVLRTDRVDLMPVDPLFLGRRIQRIGFINSRETMLDMGHALLQGLTSENGEAGRGPRARLEGSEVRQTIEAGMKPVFEGFQLARIAREMQKLKRAGTDDYERALYQVQIARRQASGKAERDFRKALRHAREEEARMAAEAAAAETAEAPRRVRLEYLKPADVRRRKKWMSDTAVERLVTRVNEGVRRNREAAGLEAPRDPGHIKGNALAAAAPKHSRSTRASSGADLSTVRPLFSIADNYTPILPQGLKRGDVIVLKIADILKPGDKRPAQRPCVVWNVYRDKTTGEVCGIEVFPRTRLRAHEFDVDFTAEFPNLYNNRVWDGGRIIAQKIARLAVTSEHFHPVTKRVRSLNPALAQEVIEKRDACVSAGKEHPAFGLAAVPDNWELCDTPLCEPSASQIAHADHIHDHLERHRAALGVAPQVGDVIMRKVMRDGEVIEVPTVVWGVWHNKVTGLPAAFECVRIDVEDKMTRAWGVALPLETADGSAVAADLSAIDLVYNTEKYFTPGSVQTVSMLDETTMEKLQGIRANVLIQCRDRKGTYPEFLPFDWERVDGPSYGFGLHQLKSRKFAPDLSECRDPGYLRRNGGRREDNRRGMIPRRKNGGFKPKRAPV